MVDDLISRRAAIEHLKKRLYETALNNDTELPYYEEMADNRVSVWLEEVPSAQRKVLKYTGESICLNCRTRYCDGCLFEPMEGVIEEG